VDPAAPPPSPLPHRPPRISAAQRRALLAQVRADCPNAPGVYRMLGPAGTVLYVGQSRTLRTRLLSYFRAKGRRNKAAKILRHAHAITWERLPTPFGALLHELRLIKQHRPLFNRALVTDDWPRAYVAVTGGAVPGVRVVRQSDHPGAVALYGPFRRVAQLRDAVRALAEATGVRDCTVEGLALGRPVRRSHAACLRHAIGNCAGPCIGGGEPASYHAGVAELRAFLEGRTAAPLARVTAAMHEAAATLAFERAGALKGRVVLLAWLRERVRHFTANVDRLTFQYRAPAADGGAHVYLVRRGTVRADCPAPRTPEEAAAFAALVARVYHPEEPAGAELAPHALDEFALVASWFRRKPEERGHAVPAGTAWTADGGVGG
jgi:excinuclease UvrABC nuclease subunit